MSHRMKVSLISVCLAVFVLMAVNCTAYALARSICLGVDKNVAHNAGGDSMTFHWQINYDTVYQSAQLQFINPSGLPCGELIDIPEIPASPIITGSHTCPVPADQPLGIYTAVLTFKSTWANASPACPAAFTDKAEVQFAICPGGRVNFCKFIDLNGNGIKDPNDPVGVGWTFDVYELNNLSAKVGSVVTDITGCTPDLTLPVDLQTLSKQYTVVEVPPLPEQHLPWMRTVPDPGPANNPFTVNVTMAQFTTVIVGNWVPIQVSGYKFEDLAPWPWTACHPGCAYANPACAEPGPGVMPCPPFGPAPITGVQMGLFDEHGSLLDVRTTDTNGNFQFVMMHYRPKVIIMQGACPPIESLSCDPTTAPPTPCSNCALLLDQWKPQWVPMAATSVWPDQRDCATPDDLHLILPPPPIAGYNYDRNFFFDWRPSRLWGFLKPLDDVKKYAASCTLTLEKRVGNTWYPWPAGNPTWCAECGMYIVDVLDCEPQGIRQGCPALDCEYRIIVSAPTNNYTWSVSAICPGCKGCKPFQNSDGSAQAEVDVDRCWDARVDFELGDPPGNPQCFLPVTFTQQGWHDIASPYSPVGDLLRGSFKRAFGEWYFYSKLCRDVLIAGKKNTITFEGDRSGLNALAAFLPQTGPACSLTMSYTNPYPSTPAGELAGETIALMLNIAYNDRQLMPRTKGYHLEKFKITRGYFRGWAVGQVLNVANAVLGGDKPQSHLIPDYATLVDALKAINSNYEFLGLDKFVNRGYLEANDGQKFNGQYPEPIPFKVPYTP